jgi:serine/threonine-protein kinase
VTAAERLRRLQELFALALDMEAAERAGWLDALDREEPTLAVELRRLIAREEGAHSIPEGLPANLLACALAPLDAAPEPAHLKAGAFVLHEVLGRGGMGCVYRGVRETAGVRQEAAVKVLRTELRNSASIQRFLTERQMLARLEHPGIARLLDAGETADGTPFVAMELVRGQPLLTHCNEKNLGIEARIDLFRQVLAAVAHAHRALVVHRDIKPSNVMVDEEGRVRLLDFGIAKALVEDGNATATVDRCFTPAYAAPEQLTGDPITVACDIYSLGALLYELLCGSAPFRLAGLRASEIERLILETPPRPMDSAIVTRARQDPDGRIDESSRRWRASLRGDLECIVQRAMRKEAEARYASVTALQEDLRNWQAHRPVRAAGGHATYRLRKFIRRNAVLSTAVVAIAVGTAVALSLIVQQGIVAQRERDRAREALSVLSDAFLAADPAGVSAGEISARNILDAASRRVAERVDARPEVYAELAAEIGKVQLALGVIDGDDRSIVRALEWARAEPAQEVLAARLALLRARRLVAAHAFAEADALLRGIERDRGPDAQVLLTRGKYWMAQGEPGRAIPVLTDALARLPAEPGDGDRIDAQWQLAEAQRLSGHPDAAQSILQTLLGQLVGAGGADQASVLLTRLRMVDVMLDLGHVAEATGEAGALARRIEDIYGRRSSVTALGYSTLALTLVRAERYRDSIEPYRIAAAAYAESLGSDHITTARSYFNLALMQTYVDPQDADSATGFRRAIDAATAARDGADPLVSFFRIEYAKSLLARAESATARDVLLPQGVMPDLDAAGTDIAAAYAEQLAHLFAGTSCTPAPALPGAGAAQARRAEYLICRARALASATP